MNTEMESRVIKVCVAPKNEPIYHERATMVEITDEGAGEYVVVSQCDDHIDAGVIKIDITDWDEIKKTIDELIKNCRDYE